MVPGTLLVVCVELLMKGNLAIQFRNVISNLDEYNGSTSLMRN